MTSKGVATVRAVGQGLVFLAGSEPRPKGHLVAGARTRGRLTPAVPLTLTTLSIKGASTNGVWS